MLDFVGTTVIATVMVVNITSVLGSLTVSHRQRIEAALAIGLWLGLAAASAAGGLFTASRPYEIGVFIVIPLTAAAALAALSPNWRAALLGLPTPLLIGLNVSRVFGAFFLLLAAAGRLSGPFPISAGWGDIATGALTLPALWLFLRPSLGGQSLLTAWNLLGTLDLVVAVTLGIASAPGSPLQIFDVGSGSTAISILPWSLIPTVLVPFYLIVHAILFVQLRQAPRQHSHNQPIPSLI